MAMALRNLVTKMPTPAAAAALRRHLPPPLPGPAAGTRRGLYYSHRSDQGPSREEARRLYLHHLRQFNYVMMDHQDYMMSRVKLLERGNKLVKWSFVLVFPLHLASAFASAVK